MITFIYTYSGKDSDLPTILYITKRFRSIFLWKKTISDTGLRGDVFIIECWSFKQYMTAI